MPKAKAYVKPELNIETVALIKVVAQLLDKTENEISALFDEKCRAESLRRKGI